MHLISWSTRVRFVSAYGTHFRTRSDSLTDERADGERTAKLTADFTWHLVEHFNVRHRTKSNDIERVIIYYYLVNSFLKMRVEAAQPAAGFRGESPKFPELHAVQAVEPLRVKTPSCMKFSQKIFIPRTLISELWLGHALPPRGTPRRLPAGGQVCRSVTPCPVGH